MNLKTLKKPLIIILLFFCSANIFANDYYKVNTERLNVRKTVGASTAPFGYVNYGDTVNVIDKSNTYWYKIRIQGKEGFVRSKYLLQINVAQTEYKGPNYILIGLISICFIIVIGIIFSFTNKKQRNNKDSLQTGTSIIIKHKSVGVAIILTLFFGPLGMFYSTVKGALIMLFLPIITIVILLLLASNNDDSALLGLAIMGSLLFYVIFYWLICIIWAAVAASKENKIIITQSQPNYNEI